MGTKKPKDSVICLCHKVTQSKIEQAIRSGCHSLGDLFDRTTAGVGPCGGSCQVYLKAMLESYLKTRSFPENPRKKKESS